MGYWLESQRILWVGFFHFMALVYVIGLLRSTSNVDSR
jgi:hypothetical protein